MDQNNKNNALFLIIFSSVLIIVIIFAIFYLLRIDKVTYVDVYRIHSDDDSLQAEENSSSDISQIQKIVKKQEVASPLTGNVYAPVLMYHHLAKVTPVQSYYVSPDIFDQQLSWLQDNNYTVISLSDFYLGLTGKKTLPSKPVTITFDDGDLDHYQNAFPILRKHGYTAAFFIKTASIGKDGYMTWGMLKEMSDAGMSIESHSVTHGDMSKMDAAQLNYELGESKKVLEQNLNTKVDFFAYPGGANSKLADSLVLQNGYLAAFTTVHQVYQKEPIDFSRVPRIHVDDEMPSFENWIQGIDL